MDLSVIIVNYNVRYFIEQCLHSVERAVRSIEAEIFVVDNNSVDGSCSMIREKFPRVKLIENKENVGFSRANNQALSKARGKYLLILNPDTVVEEDTFTKCISFMEEHPDAGALGVKMIDGTGNFLPESKRSLPTPTVAFYKIFGLSRIFPHSPVFGKYHLGHLDNNQTHEVEILAGAYMFIRKEALDKTGLLDESFFMYGEDIDLSYRIIKAGYKNYYFPETTIIHYKGESTKKGSINYVLVFYNAMIIFARKHFSRKNARFFSVLINMAIYFRAGLSIIRRFFQKIYQPLIDFLLIFAGFYFLTPVWSRFKFGTEDHFPAEYIHFIVPAYIIIFILSVYYSGGYEKPLKIWNIFKGYLTGTLILLVLYALLPESLRFSRALILLGCLWGILILLLFRLGMNLLGIQDYEFSANRKKRLLLIGNKKESERVGQILMKTGIKPEIIGTVNPSENKDGYFIGNLNQLKEVVSVHRIEEIVFCSKDIPAQEIIKNMTLLTDEKIEFKIAPPESVSIIGSNSINTAGDLYLIQFNSIASGKNRRNKRLFDVAGSMLFIFLSPFLWPFIKKYRVIFRNSFLVLAGKRTWIGYCSQTDTSMLPPLRKGVFSLCHHLNHGNDKEFIQQINLEYAREYKMANDFNLLYRNLISLK